MFSVYLVCKTIRSLIQYISPKGPEIAVISRQIANAHTLFNITMTVIWVPLIWLMVKIVMKIIPDGQKKVYSNAEPQFLDSKLVSQLHRSTSAGRKRSGKMYRAG